MNAVVKLADFEPIAREKMPGPLFDYVAGGAEDEITLAANIEAWRRIRLIPRVLVDVSKADTTTEVLGQRVSQPVLLAPVGFHKAAHPEGEAATARAAAAAQTIMVLSTMSSVRLEDVAAAAPGAPRWFQLYVHPDRGLTRSLVERAEAAGYSAICVTVDVPYLGRRERDYYNRLQFPPDVLP
jgi:isopentenyl diphosphate isomerase/L-lactate dehydrogenase-like FMN-dependent dehydrogenase